MELRFNIVYTPGTVRFLHFFAFSLLRRLNCSFRLAANGCSPEEIHLLRRMCGRYPDRAELLRLPFHEVVTHGQALSYLQSLERSDHFCFMDSDILATGDFLSDITPLVGRYAGVFSGTPLWCRDEEQILPEAFPFMVGRYNRTDKDVCLGSTFLAVYDNRVLAQVIQATGINFEWRSWPDIPSRCRDQLTRMGLARREYDVGKLLNLLLLGQGEHLVHVESPHLHHIGGMSTYISSRRGSNPRKGFFSRLRALGRRLMGPKDTQRSSGDESAVLRMERRKESMNRYFSELLKALVDHRPLPGIPNLDDSEIQERVQRVTKHVVDLHRAFEAEQL